MPITTVLPLRVAILQAKRVRPPSFGASIPCFSAREASTSQTSVSAASRWQKKRLRSRSGSLQ